MPEPLDINALSRETGVNVRTIRYYLAMKLLPPPTGRGLAAVYGAGHRDRLRLIRRWQDERLPLAEIRARLDRLDDAGVAAALVGASAPLAVPPVPAPAPAPELAPDPAAPAPTRADSAADYVRRVLGGSGAADAPARAAAHRSPGAAAAPSAPAVPAPTLARSTWERIPLSPDIELHVRRPLGRADQRRLEALLADAARLFDGRN